jgi:hypothetical protein
VQLTLMFHPTKVSKVKEYVKSVMMLLRVPKRFIEEERRADMREFSYATGEHVELLVTKVSLRPGR